MTRPYKICNDCNRKVDVNANFCPECKSQSFRTVSVVVHQDKEPVSLTHKLFYWNYDGEFVLSKSKLAGISVFALLFITGLTTSFAAGMFIVALMFAAIVFLVGYLIHYIRGKPSDAVLRYNDYGTIEDLIHLLFFWQNRNTGEFVVSKTKIISFLVFLIFSVLAAVQVSAPTLFIVIFVGLVFDAPVFLVGCGIHRLTNPNPTNPKSLSGPKEPKRIAKKEKSRPKLGRIIKRPPKEPEIIPKFAGYENEIKDLKTEYRTKEKATRNLIEKRFTPPQITYTRFISIVDKATEVFDREADSALNILHLASEESPRIDAEIDSKISVMKSIIAKIDDLSNELVLSMDSTKDGDAENLIDDMENLISSVRDYDTD